MIELSVAEKAYQAKVGHCQIAGRRRIKTDKEMAREWPNGFVEIEDDLIPPVKIPACEMWWDETFEEISILSGSLFIRFRKDGSSTEQARSPREIKELHDIFWNQWALQRMEFFCPPDIYYLGSIEPQFPDSKPSVLPLN